MTFVLSVSKVVVLLVAAVPILSELHTPSAGLSAGPEGRFSSVQTESRNLASASSASITGEKSSDRLSNELQ